LHVRIQQVPSFYELSEDVLRKILSFLSADEAVALITDQIKANDSELLSVLLKCSPCNIGLLPKVTLRRMTFLAVKNGNLDIMKELLGYGCSFSMVTLNYAAKFGNLDAMKWLRANGCTWRENVFPFAAKKGNLENMKWLHANGCPWDERTFAAAALNGNLGNMI